MKRMLISVDLEESRAAVVDDDKLVHLEIEPVNRDSVKGNIYRGVVARVEPSLQSAFVDFGRPKQGFLPVGEIHPKIRGEKTDKRTPIQQVLKAGQVILVQVTKDEIGNKGATLTTFISLPGRYLVLMPESDKTGVSRKLSDAARTRVKEITDKMKVPDGFGLIVRTAGERATKLELTKDLVYLNRLWAHIDNGFNTGKGATSLYHERSLAIRFVRDYFKRDINEIVIDDEDTLGEVTAYLKLLMPRNVSAIERYSGVIPLFARYGIAGQVESVFARQVPMRGGGSIVIDQTEALVAIDVNSGRVKGKDIEETARQTNLEAAREVARQLVLRDLGGLVVIDFIDMRDRKYVREVEAELKSAMKSDKARHKLGKISEFGLMELSRQRLKSSVNKGVFETCEYCSGTGFYRTTPSLAASVMRRIHELVAKGNIAYIVVTLPPEASNYLLNAKRTELANVEREYHVSIEIIGVEGMTASQVTIEHTKRMPSQTGAEKIRSNRLQRVTQRLDLVRNKLLKQEDARIERRNAAALSGSKVNYADVYNGVLEETAGVAKEMQEADAKREQRKVRDRERRERAKESRAQNARVAEAAAANDALEAMTPPQPTGFTSWLKGIFGMGPKPTPATLEPATVVPAAELAAPELAPEPEPAPELEAKQSKRRREPRQGREQRDGRGGRTHGQRDGESDGNNDDDEGRRGRRGGRRRRRRDDDRQQDRGQRSNTQDGDEVVATSDEKSTEPRNSGGKDERSDAASEEDRASRRRRRRRGGGRRRRRRDEDERGQSQDATDQMEETNPKVAADVSEGDAEQIAVDATPEAPKATSDDVVSDAASVKSVAGDVPAVVDARALAEARLAELRAARGIDTPTEPVAARATQSAEDPVASSDDVATEADATEASASVDTAEETPAADGASVLEAAAETVEAADEPMLTESDEVAAAATEPSEDPEPEVNDAPEAAEPASAIAADEGATAASDAESGESEAAEAAADAADAAETDAGVPPALPTKAEEAPVARNPFVIDMRSTGGNNSSSSGH